MGSPYYMSPEQMRSSKNVDFRTDIWALGVILYQLATGRVPFPGDTITEVCSGVLADDPPPLVPNFPGISPEYDAVIRRCLQKRPEHRFGNTRELASALMPIAGVSPGTSGLNLPSPVRTMAMQSNPAITGGVQPAPAMTQPAWGTTQPTPKKSGAPIAIIAVAACATLGIGLGGYLYMSNRGPATTAATEARATVTEEPTSEPTTSAAAEPTPPVIASAETPPQATSAAPASSTAPVAVKPATAPVIKPGIKPPAKPTSAPVAKPTATPTAKPAGHGIF
jgi:serine/threonine-protein kinase